MNSLDTTTLTDDDLTQHFWGELPKAEAEQIAASLRSDPELARRYQRLCQQLQALRDALPDAELSAVAITRAKLRLHRHIERERRAESLARTSWWWPALAGAAASLMVVLTFWPPATNSPIASTPIATAPIVQIQPSNNSPEANNAMLRAVRVQLAQSQQALLDLPADKTQQQVLLADIVMQNRSFAKRAQLQGQNDVARLLRAIEPVLASLASEPSPEQRAALLAQWEFETQVLQTKLQVQASKTASTTQRL